MTNINPSNIDYSLKKTSLTTFKFEIDGWMTSYSIKFLLHFHWIASFLRYFGYKDPRICCAPMYIWATYKDMFIWNNYPAVVFQLQKWLYNHQFQYVHPSVCLFVCHKAKPPTLHSLKSIIQPYHHPHDHHHQIHHQLHHHLNHHLHHYLHQHIHHQLPQHLQFDFKHHLHHHPSSFNFVTFKIFRKYKE